MVEGLIFKPGQLVRVDLQVSETATEEGQFVQLISIFLSKAHAGRKTINEEAEKVQVRSGQDYIEYDQTDVFGRLRPDFKQKNGHNLAN